jgi:hypothetical protein
MFQHCLELLQDWPFLRRSSVLYSNYSAERVTPDPDTMLMRTLRLPSSSPARQVSAAFCVTELYMNILCAGKNLFSENDNIVLQHPVALIYYLHSLSS